MVCEQRSSVATQTCNALRRRPKKANGAPPQDSHARSSSRSERAAPVDESRGWRVSSPEAAAVHEEEPSNTLLIARWTHSSHCNFHPWRVERHQRDALVPPSGGDTLCVADTPTCTSAHVHTCTHTLQSCAASSALPHKHQPSTLFSFLYSEVKAQNQTGLFSENCGGGGAKAPLAGTNPTI